LATQIGIGKLTMPNVLPVIANSAQDYEETVKDALAEPPHVKSISASFTLKTVKDSRIVPV
jgi:Lrp/AsnC family transcriptional regulator